MKSLQKLMEKKKGQEVDPQYKDAKMSMLQALRDEMSGMMKGDLDGAKMKHVEVAAPDKEGLAHGLEQAKQIVGDGTDDEDSEKDSKEDSDDSEDSEDEGSAEHMIESQIKHEDEEGELSPEEIDQLIMLLQKMKGGK